MKKCRDNSLSGNLFCISIVFLILAFSFLAVDLLLLNVGYITQIGIIMLFLGLFLLIIRWVFQFMVK